MEALKYIGEVGGISGIVALALLYIYWKDNKNHTTQLRTDRVFMEDRLSKVIKADQETRQKHTEVLSELITYLKGQNGSNRDTFHK